MAYINDFLAGLADLATLPTDAISLGMGAVKYPFKKVFTDSENPFAEGVANSWAGQISQGIRDFNTGLFDSDPESGARRAGSDIGGYALDLMTGGSGRVMRLAGKAAMRNNLGRAAKLATRAIGDTALTNTAINLGMNVLSGGQMSPTESVMAGVGAFAAPGMIRRATKGLRKKAANLEKKFAPNEAQRYANTMQYYDKVDDLGGALNAARQEGFDLDDSFLLRSKDLAKKDPILGETMDTLEHITEKDGLFNQFNQVTSELQQRLQAPITIANSDDLVTKLKEYATALGTKEDPLVVRNAFNQMSFDSLMDLMNRHPEIFPETGYVLSGTQTPISNAALVIKYNNLKSRMTEEQLKQQRQLMDLLRKDLDANHKAGLVSDREYGNELQKSVQTGYIPKSSLDVRDENMNGLLGVTPNATSAKAATQTGLGVARQSNSFETMFKNIYAHAKKRIFNDRVISLGKYLQTRVPEVVKETTEKLNQAKLQARSATGLDKKLAEMNVKYYSDRLNDLGKYDFAFKPKLDKAGNVIIPNDRNVVSYMVNGEQHFFTVPKNYMSSFFSSGDNLSGDIVKGIQAANQFAAQFKTGKFNVLNFGFVKAAYGLWEGMTALSEEAAKRGIKLPAWKIMFEQAKQAKNILSNEYYDWIIRNLEKKGSYLGYDINQIEELKKKITEPLFSFYTSPYDNFAELRRIGAARLFDFVNPDTTTKAEAVTSLARRSWNWVNDSAPVKILEMLNTASAESMNAATTKIAKELFADDPDARRKFLIDVTKKTSDTRRVPAALTKTGKTIKTLSKIMPYGKSTTQGLAGKLDYFNVGTNYDMIKNLLDGSQGMDKLINLGVVLAGKTQGEVFDMLWKFVVAPTALCYFWNNMTPDNAEDYHELTTLARSKNRLLVNFGGRGVHAYFPVDQEWSLLSNITEAMLDTAFGMSGMDPNNPEWSNKDQLLKAAGRALGVEFPTPVNMLTGAIGFEGNVNAETLLGGEDSILEPIKGTGLEGRISYELGETLGTLGNMLSIGTSDRPFNIDMIGQVPLLTDSWSQQHNNNTSAYVDKIYRQDPQNFPCKDLMIKRKYMESRLRHFKATGKTMDGRPYNMPRQKVIETINHNIQKLNGEMYRILKDQD